MPPHIEKMAIEIVKQFLQQASLQGSRSTVLSPLGWLAATLLAGWIGLLWRQAPHWVIVLMAVLLCLCIALYLIAYVYFMTRTPDALRSERFTLNKLAIEKGMMGDNASGFSTVESSRRLIEAHVQGEAKQ